MVNRILLIDITCSVDRLGNEINLALKADVEVEFPTCLPHIKNDFDAVINDANLGAMEALPCKAFIVLENILNGTR